MVPLLLMYLYGEARTEDQYIKSSSTMVVVISTRVNFAGYKQGSTQVVHAEFRGRVRAPERLTCFRRPKLPQSYIHTCCMLAHAMNKHEKKIVVRGSAHCPGDVPRCPSYICSGTPKNRPLNTQSEHARLAISSLYGSERSPDSPVMRPKAKKQAVLIGR
jgi:hypothetical protein